MRVKEERIYLVRFAIKEIHPILPFRQASGGVPDGNKVLDCTVRSVRSITMFCLPQYQSTEMGLSMWPLGCLSHLLSAPGNREREFTQPMNHLIVKQQTTV